MNPNTRLQLSFMMFLEYFIWGAWYVSANTYMVTNLHATGSQVSYAYMALAVATMISPFFVGMIADRYFSAQKIMGVLHLVGAATLYLTTITSNTYVFIGVVLFYSLLYMPTIALSNSIAFRHLSDPGRTFPAIRMFGTIGWIVAGLLIGYLSIEKTAYTFDIAAGASSILAFFSFFSLPDTPPQAKSDVSASQALGTEAFVLFRDRSYLVFFISAVLICIPLSF